MIKTILLFGIVIVAVFSLIPIVVVVFVLSIIGLRNAASLMMYRIAQGWSLFLIKLTGCKLTVQGRENIPGRGGICFVSNHGSIFDILLILAYAGRPIGFVAKKELIFIPILNMWVYLLGGLFIDRKHIKKAVGTINKGIARIKNGGAMVIFPEGHRSRGEGLLPFHPGSLKLATQAGAPIIPLALQGSYDVFEKNYRIVGVPVSVSFGEPIETSSLGPDEKKQALADRVRNVIASAMEESS
jgi:1-acyl-sn-glycerol-3-phosphate acyltransferase